MIINYLGHMITQKEFVNGCYRYYAENYYEPGNPEDGIWEEAHYPVPECKGGKETVLLLKQHHAVHNVIQSEELQYPCVWHWEREYLPGEYLDLFDKWRNVSSHMGGNTSRNKFGTKLRITYPDGTTVNAESYTHASTLLNVGKSIIKRLLTSTNSTYTVTRAVPCTHNVAFEYAPTPVYWAIDNSSKPKPLLIHYPDGTVVYAESIKHAVRLTNVNQSTIQHRLKKTIEEQTMPLVRAYKYEQLNVSIELITN